MRRWDDAWAAAAAAVVAVVAAASSCVAAVEVCFAWAERRQDRACLRVDLMRCSPDDGPDAAAVAAAAVSLVFAVR